MKRNIFSLFVIFCSCVISAQSPVLVGHRGSDYGIENTIDAFQHGIDRGYTALETDIHITKDGHFVCSHDDVLTEWGYPKVMIEKTKLKKLLSLTLKQTRWGKEYTGHITTFEEYLALCKANNIIPVIEFKYTTGINEKDLSNLPAVLQIVKDYGMMDKAIFISFMKAPLQWIREHEDPSVDVQYLCMPHNERFSFEWMKKYHIDLDICMGFSREMVKRYHDVGLKVNCWTIDRQDIADEEIDFGVDFLTTNLLTPADVQR